VRLTDPPLRVAIVAEHASARFGGEAFLPLHYFRRLLARGHDVHLFSHSRAQTELESLLPDERDRMHFVEDSLIHRSLFALGRPLPSKLAESTTGLASHLYTQAVQRRQVMQLHRQAPFDVIHQPIPVAPRFPSLLHDMGAPVVIGPLNGGMNYPPGFSSHRSGLGATLLRTARFLSDAVHYALPGKLQAEVVLVANRRTRESLPPARSGPVVELVENGVDLHSHEGVENHTRDSRRFLFVGRLVEGKAVDIAIRALAQTPPDLGFRIDIAGDGPLRPALEQCAKVHGVADRVRFLGFLPQSACLLKMQTAGALLLPSLVECGGAVVLEAMAAGCPVVATNWGGPADYLNEECGVLVEPLSEAHLIQSFAAAMTRLAQDRHWARSLADRAIERVRREFTWDAKIDRIIEIYEAAIRTHQASQPALAYR
jgi:glycosyltransferase involved in cell wall biosynthesis